MHSKFGASLNIQLKQKNKGGFFMFNTMLERLENTYFEPLEDVRRVCFQCSACEGDICEDDDYYKLLGLIICQDCIDDAHNYAELDE